MAAKMGHIFISYSHKDKAYIHKLQEALRNEGFEVWVDDRIDYGTEWPKVIQKHLDECDAFIIVVSDNAYESKWVQNELARAERKKKPFFPLLLSGDPWLTVEATQYFDVSNKSLPTEKFYERLALVTPRRKQESTPQPQPSPKPRKTLKELYMKSKIPATISLSVIGCIVIASLALSLATSSKLLVTKAPSDTQSFNVSNVILSMGDYTTNSFSRNQDINVNIDLDYTQPNTQFTSRLYYQINIFEKDIYILRTKLIYTSKGGDTHIYFKFNNPRLAGYYRVDIYMEQNLVASRYFSIQ